MLENAGMGTRLTLVIRLNCLNEAVTWRICRRDRRVHLKRALRSVAFSPVLVNARWVPGVVPAGVSSGLAVCSDETTRPWGIWACKCPDYACLRCSIYAYWKV